MAARAGMRFFPSATELFPMHVWLALSFLATAGASSDTVVMSHDPSKYQVLVSATKTQRSALEVPNGTAIVTREELKRAGARTLADALQDVVGLDTGDGSDNGSRLPNVGMWGLKEFDALLITLDGVPVGGPFNPSLAMVDVDDIDHLEIVKGPQGTLYGVSAFAGMIQVFSRETDAGRGAVAAGGGSFGDMHGALSLSRRLADGLDVRLSGSLARGDGWQDRTASELDRGSLFVRKAIGSGALSVTATGFRNDQHWGTPLPFDAGEPLPGFDQDRNYAVSGARVEHRVFLLTSTFTHPVGDAHSFENTLGYSRDDQFDLRSFPGEVAGDTVVSEGVLLKPRESVAFDDARLVSRFELGGHHELVTGAAVTWGRTVASGIGFDFEQLLSEYPPSEGVGSIPVGDNRNFTDRRTFFGAYVHDEFTPAPRVTLSGGGRYDNASEKLHAFGQEVGDPEADVADDERTDGAFSGDLALLLRLAPASGVFQAANLYGNWKSSFKPAAPNLTEPEGAKILKPERTHSYEGGFKSLACDGQLGFDVSWFNMDFENLVVAQLDSLGDVERINAGKERFKGIETTLMLKPWFVPGASLSLGYAHHDATFVQFTFVTPDGTFRDVSGKRLELVPRELFNAKAAYVSPVGLGGFVATRYQGERPFNRRNTFFDDPFTFVDAGLSYVHEGWHVAVTGRNLGDVRHPISESDIGDSQFYMSPPQRYSAEVSFDF